MDNKSEEPKIEKKGLVDRSGSRFPMSRDFALDLICKCQRCFLNQHGKCSSPASVTLDGAGRCEMYPKAMEMEKLRNPRT